MRRLVFYNTKLLIRVASSDTHAAYWKEVGGAQVVYCSDESQLNKWQQRFLQNSYKQTVDDKNLRKRYDKLLNYTSIVGILIAILCTPLGLFLSRFTDEWYFLRITTGLTVFGIIAAIVAVVTLAIAYPLPSLYNKYVDWFNQKLIDAETGINTSTDVRFQALEQADSQGVIRRLRKALEESDDNPTWTLIQSRLSAYLSDNELLAVELGNTKRHLDTVLADLLDDPRGVIRSSYYHIERTYDIGQLAIQIEEAIAHVDSEYNDLNRERDYRYSHFFADERRSLHKLESQLQTARFRIDNYLQSCTDAERQLWVEYQKSLESLEANAATCIQDLNDCIKIVDQEKLAIGQAHQLNEKIRIQSLSDNLRIAREISQTSY